MSMKFSTQHLTNIFAEEGKYDAFKNLQFDLSNGNEIYEYDEDGNKTIITKREANKALLNVAYEILGLDKDSVKSKKSRKRALEKHGTELFEVLEENIDFKVEEGFRESEWFNKFVEEKNLAKGDENEFWSDENVILTVAKVSGDHHDLTMQKLAEGESYRVPVSKYAVKVGTDIDLWLTGRIDYTKLIDKVAEAYVVFIQTEMYAEVVNASEKLPSNSQFVKTGALSPATKEMFDTLLEDVSIANNASVYIMGVKSALRKLNALTEIEWLSESQKESVAKTGRLGSYEDVTLFEIPQRFAINDTTTKLVDPTKLFIFAQTEDKFVKFVNVGETEILEVTEKGATRDDFASYEVQREMGIGTQLSKFFGVWNIEV